MSFRDFSKWDDIGIDALRLAMASINVPYYRIGVFPGVVIFQVREMDSLRVYSESVNDGKLHRIRPYNWTFVVDSVPNKDFRWKTKQMISIRTKTSIVANDRIKL